MGTLFLVLDISRATRATIYGMNEEILKKIEEQKQKLDAIHKSVDKMRKYFLWTFWITILLFVLPLVGLIFVIPFFLDSYLGSLGADSGGTDQTLEQIDTLRSLLE